MSGVMDSVCHGAKDEDPNALTIGILPGKSSAAASPYIDIAIPTNMGNARNSITVLAGDAVIACGMGAGTASEVALAAKSNRYTILLDASEAAVSFFQSLPHAITTAETPEKAIEMIKDYLNGKDS
jgi:hypothetical protein